MKTLQLVSALAATAMTCICAGQAGAATFIDGSFEFIGNGDYGIALTSISPPVFTNGLTATMLDFGAWNNGGGNDFPPLCNSLQS